MNLTVEPVRAPRRFQFVRCLGVGGFGEVYLAEMTTDTGLVTRVAVKLLRAGASDPANPLERLRDEARVLGRLDHPVILRVNDLIEIDGRTALVMQFIDGCDLDGCVRSNNPIPEGAQLEVIGQIADALQHAWGTLGPKGAPLELVHRDVKPSNIRIGKLGQVKLLDFGIARANLADREALTRNSLLIGSPPYMAPERFDEHAPVAPSSDIFSLGCTLFEGLVRRRLFGKLSLKDQYALVLDPRKFTAHLQAALAGVKASAETRTLLEEMLSFSPESRPTAGAVRARCEALAAARPPTLRAWLRDWTWPEERERESPLLGLSLLEGSGQSGRRSLHTPLPDVSGTLSAKRPVAWMAGVFGIVGLGAVLGTAGVAFLGAAGTVWTFRSSAEPQAIPAPLAPRPEPPPEPAAAPVAAPVAPPPAPVDPAPPILAVPRAVPAPPPPKGASSPAASPVTALRPADVPVELRGPGGAHAPGPIPPGTYEIWADFGEGPVLAGTATAAPGETAQLRCSRVKRTCAAGAP